MPDTRKSHRTLLISYPRALDTNIPLPEPAHHSPPPVPSPTDNGSEPASSPVLSSPSPMASRTRSHARKPSFTNTMSWLTRSVSSVSSAPHAHPSSALTPTAKPTTPIRISEPKLCDPLSSPTANRCGQLGTGALVVRTPQEALAGSGVTVEYVDPQDAEQDTPTSTPIDAVPELTEEEEGGVLAGDGAAEEDAGPGPELRLGSVGESAGMQRIRVPPAYSPPRPALPLSKSTPCLTPTKHDAHPPAPARPCPPRPSLSDSLPVAPLKPKNAPVPSLPAFLAAPSPQPPFDCVPLSDIHAIASHGPLDPSKLIVTLETATATHRTTLATITSRPSYLGAHLLTLLTPPSSDPEHDRVGFDNEEDEDEVLSVPVHDDDYSDGESAFRSIFKQHLASSGLLPPSPSVASSSAARPVTMHIFLDRPSEPYGYILNYLRSPPATAECVYTLPPALRLQPDAATASAILAALRDEAHYLGLPDLVALCAAELRARFNATQLTSIPSSPQHTRDPSSGSLRTLREEPPHVTAPMRDSVESAGSGSTSVSVRSGSNASDRQRLASRERTDGVTIASQRTSGSPPPCSLHTAQSTHAAAMGWM